MKGTSKIMKRTETIMKHFHHLKTSQAALAATILVSGTMLLGGIASAATSVTANASASSGSSKTSTATANQQQRVQNIITKGNEEIERRLTTLGTLNTKITAATHLNSSDKATLSSEVSTTISGLTSLKATLDADTTVSSAHTDAESIYTEYRVYALVAPKVGLIKVADDQQVVQGMLTTMSGKLQTRITAEQQAGKSVTTLQSELTDMDNQIAAASTISKGIESSVITLQPSDYNSNHAVLSGDNTQLKTAHSDDQNALTDAHEIASAL
jgi:hypothetical protein